MSTSDNSASSTPTEEERFATNIFDLTQEIRDLIVECRRKDKTKIDPNIITIASAFIESYDKKVMIENFIHYSYEFWDKISKREESFFRENCGDVFKDLPSDHVRAFSELFNDEGEAIISADDKNLIWDYFGSLIKISLKYIHRERGPKIRDIPEGKGPQRVYSKNAFKDVRLQHYANMWDLKLEW